MNFKKISIILISVILGIVLLLFAVFMLYPKDGLIAKIEQQIYDQTQLNVNIGHLRPAIFGLTIKNLQISAEDEKQLNLRLDEATIKLKLLPLLKKKIIVSKAILNKPSIVYDLSYTFPQTESKTEQAPTSADAGYDIQLDEFLINNAEIHILDQGKEVFSTHISQQKYAINTKGTQAYFVQGKINVDELLYHSDYGVLGRGLSPKVDFSVNYDSKQAVLNLESFKINDDSIASNLTGQGVFQDDPQFDVNFSASSDHLKQLIAFLPSKLFNAKELRSANGRLNVQLNYKGGSDYQKAIYDGEFKLSEGIAKYKKNIENIFAHVTFNKDNINIHQFKANTEKSYIDMKGSIANYVEAAERAKININAKYKIDFDELSAIEMLPKGEKLAGEVQGNMTIANTVHQPNLNGKTELKNISYQSADIDYMKITQLNGALQFSNEKINFKIPKMVLNDDVLTAEGHFNGALAYALADKALKYDINVQAESFDLNPFLQEEDTPKTDEAVDFEFLQNINGQVSFVSKTVKYEELLLKNVSGLLQTQQGRITLKDIKANAFSGLVVGNFELDTKNIKAYPYTASLNVDKVEINQLIQYTKNYFPIDISKATKIGGDLFSQMSSSGKINHATLLPELNTISFSGPIRIAQGYLKQSSLQNIMSQFLKKDSLKSLNFKTWKQYLEFNDGQFLIKDIALNNDKFNMMGSGTQSLDGKIDYQFKLKLPKSDVKHLLPMGISDSDQQQTVTLPIVVSGNLSNPQISVDQAFIKNQISNKVQNTIEREIEKKSDQKIENKKEILKNKTKEKLKGLGF